MGKTLTKLAMVMTALLALAAPAVAQIPSARLPETAAGIDPPITVVVTRVAKRGCEAAFEALNQQTFSARNSFPGHISTDFLRPATPQDPTYRIIFRFAHTSNYVTWLASPERSQWLARLDALTEGNPRYQIHPGLEAWVTPDEPTGTSHPPKYKTAAVTWLAIYPLVMGSMAVVAPFTVGASTALRTAAVTLIVVPAMTYVVMPPLTWLFRDWLYPPAPDCKGGGVAALLGPTITAPAAPSPAVTSSAGGAEPTPPRPTTAP